MSFFYNVIILPIESILEFAFCYTLEKFDVLGVGGAIVAVSLIMNFLALPLYNMADALQLKERNIQNAMAERVKRIKLAFKGDERFMMMQAYYRLNNYHPLYAVRSSLSILIEIPFFIAGYHFLSHCPALSLKSFFVLKDLGEPDRLIGIPFLFDGSIRLNVLPLLMTFINIVSTNVYTKGAPLKEKLQTYALALIFLFILYDSPSGLVFYWILNNLFSLCKNVVLKMNNPGKVLRVIIGFLLLLISEYVFMFRKGSSVFVRLFLFVFTGSMILYPIVKQWRIKDFFENILNKNKDKIIIGLKVFAFICILLCAYYDILKPTAKVYKKFLLNFGTVCVFLFIYGFERFFYEKRNFHFASKLMLGGGYKLENNFWLFVLAGLNISALCGFYLPSCIIATSPEEFIIARSGIVYNPLNLVVSSSLYYSGLFFVWPLCIYKMFGSKIKKYMTLLFYTIFICSLCNALVFHNKYGSLNIQFNSLNVEEVFNKDFLLVLGSLFVFAISIPILHFNALRKKIPLFLFAILMVQLVIGVSKVNKISRSFLSYKNETYADVNRVVDEGNNIIPQIKLSKTEKNVVVLFLDRAIPSTIPTILNEFPKLKKDFSGFVSYQNCVGFGTSTNVSIPAMLGGYDYTPAEVAKRPGWLGDKQLESLKLMPKLFSDGGFDVTFLDIPYANRNYTFYDFDPSVYDDIPGMTARNIADDIYAKLKNDFSIEEVDYELYQKSIREFNLMQILFPGLRKRFYNDGNYYFVKKFKTSSALNNYPRINLNAYAELYYMKDLTSVDSDKPTFTVIGNMLTHMESRYKLYGKDYTSLHESDGLRNDPYQFDSEYERTSYQSNACAFNLIAKWFEYLKENKCYDNTRIIIVSDHGYGANYQPFLRPEFSDLPWNSRRAFFNPVLMVKDFGSSGDMILNFDKFTSNAEVLNHCIKDLGFPNVNPFTGNRFKKDSDYEYFDITAIRQELPTWTPEIWSEYDNWNVSRLAFGIRVKKSVFDPENWSEYEYDK